MKRLAIIAGFLVAATVHLNAQGTVSFSNLASPISSSPRVFIQTDAGTTTFVPTGSQFRAELAFAPDGTTPEAFGDVATRVGSTAPFGPLPGIFVGGNRTAPITPSGGFGLFQVRVWETAGGSDYRTAVTTGSRDIRAGTSDILRIDTSDPTTVPPGVPVSLIAAGLTSFTLTPIPEPSAYAVGALGIAAFWFLHHRKRV